MRFRLPQVHVRHSLRDSRLYTALIAEFLGVLFFQLLSGTVSQGPLETAATFAACMYFTQHLSGGHLNPVVSLAAAGTGYIDFARGLLYVIAQLLGALVGALLQVWLSYDANFGQPSESCLHPHKGVSGPQLWGWEFALTTFFSLVMVSAVFVPPGQGIAAPLAGGLALFAALATGGYYTGVSPLNPARVLANMLVFRCNVSWGWSYLMAYLAAVGAVVAWVWPVHGLGFFMGGPRPDAQSSSSAGGGGAGLNDPLLEVGRGGGDPAGLTGYGRT